MEKGENKVLGEKRYDASETLAKLAIYRQEITDKRLKTGLPLWRIQMKRIKRILFVLFIISYIFLAVFIVKNRIDDKKNKDLERERCWLSLEKWWYFYAVGADAKVCKCGELVVYNINRAEAECRLSYYNSRVNDDIKLDEYMDFLSKLENEEDIPEDTRCRDFEARMPDWGITNGVNKEYRKYRDNYFK